MAVRYMHLGWCCGAEGNAGHRRVRQERLAEAGAQCGAILASVYAQELRVDGGHEHEIGRDSLHRTVRRHNVSHRQLGILRVRWVLRDVHHAVEVVYGEPDEVRVGDGGRRQLRSHPRPVHLHPGGRAGIRAPRLRAVDGTVVAAHYAEDPNVGSLRRLQHRHQEVEVRALVDEHPQQRLLRRGEGRHGGGDVHARGQIRP